jgi:hypothetical protein
MILRKGQEFLMRNGANGINVRSDTILSPWAKNAMEFEAPVRFEGGALSVIRLVHSPILMRIHTSGR